MIKRMEGEHVTLIQKGETEVVMIINGQEIPMTVDALKEMQDIAQTLWNANDLYQWTSQAIEERKRWEEEQAERFPGGMPTIAAQQLARPRY